MLDVVFPFADVLHTYNVDERVHPTGADSHLSTWLHFAGSKQIEYRLAPIVSLPNMLLAWSLKTFRIASG